MHVSVKETVAHRVPQKTLNDSAAKAHEVETFGSERGTVR
jgi:hypothetical protein